MWRSVLVAEYGSIWGGWRSCDITEAHGVGLGSLFVWCGEILRSALDLTLGLTPRSVSRRMYGVGRALSKILFLVCLALQDQKRRLLRIMWSILMVSSSETMCSLI
jgi:hypothetical protein